MELNGDGNLDILSGSYSRQDEDMAGLFQVLWGQKGGTWKKPEVLNGSDGQPLILPRSEAGGGGDGEGSDRAEGDDVTDRICTRPTAVDLDGDGKLDIVAGNFTGTFAWFHGEGGGKFAPKAEWLQADGKRMQVDVHGDPFFVDHDGDGDLDLFSGSASGGVVLFPNVGSKTAPKFGAKVTLLEAKGHHDMTDENVHFGDHHIVAPQSDTRVWLADVDGDKKLDLLVGDTVRLMHLVDGVDEKTGREKYVAWRKKQQEFFQQPQPEGEDGQQKWQQAYEALEKELETFAKQESTGFVWLLRGK